MLSKKLPQTLLKFCCCLPLFFFSVISMANDLVNQPAPVFELKSQGGGQPGVNINLADLKGRIVLINFWASWCAPCRDELPKLDELYQKYKEQGVIVLGINVDADIDQAMKFLQKVPVIFPVLLDTDNQVLEQYHVEAMPTTFLIDRRGVIHSMHQGYREGYMDMYVDKITSIMNMPSD